MGAKSFEDGQGPIEAFSWGLFRVCGQEHGEVEGTPGKDVLGVGKDIRVVGTVVTEWAERKGHQLTFEMVTLPADQPVDCLLI